MDDDDQYAQEVMRELQAREQEEIAVLAAKAIQRIYNQLPDDELSALMWCANVKKEDIREQP